MADLNDTQPRSPFEQPLEADRPPINTPPEEQGGPGCFLWGLLGVIAIGFSLAIVGLAGTAGWTAGEREWDTLATATQSSRIQQQLAQFPNDVAAGNLYFIDQRVTYLETVAPNMPELAGIRATATTVYLNSLPTATSEPTITATPPAEITPEATAEVTAEATERVIEPTSTNTGQLDLAALLEESRQEIADGDYEAAQETLDIIIRSDRNYQRETVRALMYEALTTRAQALYRSPDTLAEAIRLTDQAEEYGPVGQSTLNYERLIATLYLDADRAIGAGDHLTAISRLQDILIYQSSYQNVDINRLLFQEYVDYARAWEAGQEYCQAVVQYQNALNLFDDPTIVAARDTAQQTCQQGTTATPGTPGAVSTPETAPATVAPIGETG